MLLPRASRNLVYNATVLNHVTSEHWFLEFLGKMKKKNNLGTHHSFWGLRTAFTPVSLLGCASKKRQSGANQVVSDVTWDFSDLAQNSGSLTASPSPKSGNTLPSKAPGSASWLCEVHPELPCRTSAQDPLRDPLLHAQTARNTENLHKLALCRGASELPVPTGTGPRGGNHFRPNRSASLNPSVFSLQQENRKKTNNGEAGRCPPMR